MAKLGMILLNMVILCCTDAIYFKQPIKAEFNLLLAYVVTDCLWKEDYHAKKRN